MNVGQIGKIADLGSQRSESAQAASEGARAQRGENEATMRLMSAILASTLRALRVQFYLPDKIVDIYSSRY